MIMEDVSNSTIFTEGVDGTGGFGDLLQQAEQLAVDIDGDGELPRVERNLCQLVDAGQQLLAHTSHTVSKDASDVKALSSSEDKTEACVVRDPAEVSSNTLDLCGRSKKLNINTKNFGCLAIRLYVCGVCRLTCANTYSIEKHLKAKHSTERNVEKQDSKESVADDTQKVNEKSSTWLSKSNEEVVIKACVPQNPDEKRSSENGNVKNIEPSYSTVTLYVCGVCQQTFKTRNCRQEHLVAEHSKEITEWVANNAREEKQSQATVVSPAPNNNNDLEGAKVLVRLEPCQSSTSGKEGLIESREYSPEDSDDCCIVGESHAGISSNASYEIITLDSSDSESKVSKSESKSTKTEFTKKRAANYFALCQEKQALSADKEVSLPSPKKRKKPCSDCGKKFHTLYDLQQHVTAKHTSKSEKNKKKKKIRLERRKSKIQCLPNYLDYNVSPNYIPLPNYVQGNRFECESNAPLPNYGRENQFNFESNAPLPNYDQGNQFEFESNSLLPMHDQGNRFDSKAPLPLPNQGNQFESNLPLPMHDRRSPGNSLVDYNFSSTNWKNKCILQNIQVTRQYENYEKFYNCDGSGTAVMSNSRKFHLNQDM